MISEKEVSRELTTFSRWIKVSQFDVDRARCLADQLIICIKQDSNYKIDHCRFAGSFAKDTSTFLKLDIDVVIYVNYDGNMNDTKEILKFLGGVREDWKGVVLRNFFSLREDDFFWGKYAVHFEWLSFIFNI